MNKLVGAVNCLSWHFFLFCGSYITQKAQEKAKKAERQKNNFTCLRAVRLPSVSSAWAAQSVSRRVCSMRSRHSAIQWATTSYTPTQTHVTSRPFRCRQAAFQGNVAYVLVELFAKGFPGGGTPAEQLQRHLSHAHGSHAVMQPARTQTALSDLKASAFAYQQRKRRLERRDPRWLRQILEDS